MSLAGSVTWQLTLLLWIKETTNSVTLAGILTMSSALVGVLAAPLGGVIADIHPRRRILMFCELVCATLAIIALLFFVNAVSQPIKIGALLSLAILCAACTALMNPSLGALIPQLVDKPYLPKANAIAQFTDGTVTLICRALVGVLFVVVGPTILLLVDGLSYLLSSICSWRIKVPGEVPNSHQKSPTVAMPWQRKLWEGFGYVAQQRGLMWVFVGCAATNFFTAALPVLLIFFTESPLNLGTAWYGFLLASMTLGHLTGSVVFGYLSSYPNAPRRLALTSLPIMGSALTVLGLCSSAIPTLVLLFILGATAALFNLCIFTHLQLAVLEKFRGRLLGLYSSLSSLLNPLGVGAMTLLAGLLGQNIPPVFQASGLAIIFVGGLLLSQRDYRDLWKRPT